MKIKLPSQLIKRVAQVIVDRAAKRVIKKYYLASYPQPYLVILHSNSALGLWALRNHWFEQLLEVFGIEGLREVNADLVPDIADGFPHLTFYGLGISVLTEDINSGLIDDLDIVPLSDYPENN